MLVARRVLRAQRRALIAIADGADAEKIDLPSEPDLRRFLHALHDAAWNDDVARELSGILARLSKERAAAALRYVQADVDPDFARLLDQANQRAVDWANHRVGNLITEVSQTTRQAVNTLVGDATAEGLTNRELAERLAGSFDFSDARALVIARTESANAEIAGTLVGYRESGVVQGKAWSADGEACDICQALDGETVALESNFSNGTDGPPAHPNCRCSVVPVLEDEPQ